MLLGGEGLLQLWSDSVGTQGKVEAPDHVKPAKPDDKPSATERLGGRAGETSHRDHRTPSPAGPGPGPRRAWAGPDGHRRQQPPGERPPWEGGSD